MGSVKWKSPVLGKFEDVFYSTEENPKYGSAEEVIFEQRLYNLILYVFFKTLSIPRAPPSFQHH